MAEPGDPHAAPQVPVGLRILRLWGYPFRRANLVSEQSSVFLFPLSASVVLLGTIYAIGLLFAWHDRVSSAFLTNPLVPALLIATGWSAVWISWAGSVYERWGLGPSSSSPTPGSVPALELRGDLPQRLKAHWDRLCNLKVSGAYAALVIAAVVLYLYVSIYGPASLPVSAPAAIRAIYAYPNQSPWMFVYLAAVAAILADIGSFGLFFTVEHLRFISEYVQAERSTIGTGASTTVKMLYLARKPLQELAYASFLSSMAWFGAVTVLVAVFVVELNVVTFLVVTVFMALGLYVFLRPQWEFHELIRVAKASALDKLEETLGSEWYDRETHAPKREDVPTLLLAQNVAAISDWHVDIRLVLAQIVGAVFPLVAAVLGGPLGVHVG